MFGEPVSALDDGSGWTVFRTLLQSFVWYSRFQSRSQQNTKTFDNINSLDSWADPRILYGDIVLSPPVGEECSALNSTATGCYCHWSQKNAKECAFHDTSTGLIHLAHANGVEVYPSIGGWTLSDPFPAMAADATSRQHFAQKCVELIQEYQFDGIDIDWEVSYNRNNMVQECTLGSHSRLINYPADLADALLFHMF